MPSLFPVRRPGAVIGRWLLVLAMAGPVYLSGAGVGLAANAESQPAPATQSEPKESEPGQADREPAEGRADTYTHTCTYMCTHTRA